MSTEVSVLYFATVSKSNEVIYNNKNNNNNNNNDNNNNIIKKKLYLFILIIIIIVVALVCVSSYYVTLQQSVHTHIHCSWRYDLYADLDLWNAFDLEIDLTVTFTWHGICLSLAFI